MELRYNVIVLKKKEVGETDRLYTLYTLEQGKVQLMAKGVRKAEAKLAGQLETLMQGMVIVVKGKGTGKIAGAVAEKNFLDLRQRVDVLKRVLETVNIFERLVGWDEPDATLFNLLATYLALADDWSEQQERVLVLTEGFLFQLFAHLGYRVETGVCAVSGEKLKSGERHFFSPGAGGIMAGEHSHTVDHAFPISESTIKLIRLFLNNRLESLSRIRVKPQEVREAGKIATHFFRWIDR